MRYHLARKLSGIAFDVLGSKNRQASSLAEYMKSGALKFLTQQPRQLWQLPQVFSLFVSLKFTDIISCLDARLLFTNVVLIIGKPNTSPSITVISIYILSNNMTEQKLKSHNSAILYVCNPKSLNTNANIITSL
jgi:hypothetical protein